MNILIAYDFTGSRGLTEKIKKVKKVLTTSNRCDSIYLADAVKIRIKRQRSIKNEP